MACCSSQQLLPFPGGVRLPAVMPLLLSTLISANCPSPDPPPLAAEKDIKEMKGKQEAAARKHAAALEEREKARAAFVAAERAAAEAEAEATHRRAEVQAAQVRRVQRAFLCTMECRRRTMQHNNVVLCCVRRITSPEPTAPAVPAPPLTCSLPPSMPFHRRPTRGWRRRWRI